MANNITGVAPYLKVLMDYARANVPEKLHSKTVMYLKATAGEWVSIVDTSKR